MAPARFKQTDFGHLFALEALRHRRHRVDVDEGVVAGAALDEIDERHLIDDRIRLRHDDDRRHAAGRRGMACRLQRFAVLVAGLAGEHLGVDQAGSTEHGPCSR